MQIILCETHLKLLKAWQSHWRRGKNKFESRRVHCRRDALKLLRLYEIYFQLDEIYFQLDDLSLWDFNWRKVFHILLTAVLRALGFVYFSCSFLAFACSELCMMALCVCFCACEKRKNVADKIFNSSTLYPDKEVEDKMEWGPL